jgi:hypothetical protein
MGNVIVIAKFEILITSFCRLSGLLLRVAR